MDFQYCDGAKPLCVIGIFDVILENTMEAKNVSSIHV
jgi:hypothetical protein